MSFNYRPKGVCSTQISIDLEGNIVREVRFVGGCDGNLHAITRLVAGLTVDELERKLSGINCGRKGTSCADQLSKAVRQAYLASQKAAGGKVPATR